MNRSLPPVAVLALVLGIFGVAGVLAPPNARSAAPDGRFSLSGSRVHVYNLVGTVEVVPGSGRSVTVESTTGGRDGGRIDVKTMSGSEPALIFTYPASERRIVYKRNGASRSSSFRVDLDVGADGRFGDGWGKNGIGLGRRKVEIRSDGSGLEAWADLRVAVPEGQKADIHLGVGGVRVTNVNGELRLDCAAGAVEASGTRGALYVDTGSGAVSVRDAADVVSVDTGSGAVSLIDFRGSLVTVDTGSGSVKLAAVTASRQVEVDTGSGSVEVVDVRSPRVGVDTGSGRVFLRLAADVDVLDVDTGSGSVTVEAPSTLDATVRMETGSGGLDVDFPIRLLHREDDSLHGTIGRGRGQITLETGSGRIRLVKV